LFEVPDLQEVKASEAGKAIVERRTGKPFSAQSQDVQKCLLKGYDLMDKNYFASQEFRPANAQ
jgi:hypothetical protein